MSENTALQAQNRRLINQLRLVSSFSVIDNSTTEELESTVESLRLEIEQLHSDAEEKRISIRETKLRHADELQRLQHELDSLRKHSETESQRLIQRCNDTANTIYQRLSQERETYQSQQSILREKADRLQQSESLLKTQIAELSLTTTKTNQILRQKESERLNALSECSILNQRIDTMILEHKRALEIRDQESKRCISQLETSLTESQNDVKAARIELKQSIQAQKQQRDRHVVECAENHATLKRASVKVQHMLDQMKAEKRHYETSLVERNDIFDQIQKRLQRQIDDLSTTVRQYESEKIISNQWQIRLQESESARQNAEKRLSSIIQEHDDAIKQSSTSQDQIQCLDEKLKKSENELISQRQTLKLYELNVKETKQRATDLETEMKMVRNQYTTLFEQHQIIIQNTRDSARDGQSYASSMQAEVGTLLSTIEQRDTKLKKLHIRIHNDRSLEHDLQRSQERIERLQADLERSRKNTEDVENDRIRLVNENEQGKYYISQLVQRFNTSEASLKIANQARTELESRLETVIERHTKCMTSLHETEKQLADSHIQIQSLEQDIHHLTLLLETKTSELESNEWTTRKELIDTLRTDNTALQTRISELEKSRVETVSEIQRLNQERDTLQENHTSLATKTVRIEERAVSEIRALQTEIQHYHEQIEKLQKDIQQLRTELNEAHAATRIANEQAGRLADQIQSDRNRWDMSEVSYKQVLETLRKEHDEAITTQTELNRQLSQICQTHTESNDTYQQTVDQTKHDMQLIIRTLEDQISLLTSEKKTAQKTIDEMTRELRRIGPYVEEYRSLKTGKSDLEIEKNRLVVSLQKSNQELEKVQTQLISITQRAVTAETECNHMTSLVQSIESTLKEKSDALCILQSTSQRTESGLQKKISTLESKISYLQGEKSSQSSITDQRERLQNENEQLRQQINTLQNKYNHELSCIETLQKSLSDTEHTRNNAVQKSEQFEKRIIELTEIVRKTEARSRSLHETLEYTRTCATNYNNDFERVSNELRLLHEKEKDLQIQLSSTCDTCNSIQWELKRTQEVIQSSQETIKKLNEEKNTLQLEQRELEKSYRDTQYRLAILEETSTTSLLRSKYEECAEALEKTRQSVIELKTALSEATEREYALKATVEHAGKSSLQQGGILAESRARIIDLEKQLKDISSRPTHEQYAEARKSAEQWSSEHRSMTRKMMEVQRRLDLLHTTQQQLLQVEKSLQSEKSRVIALQKENKHAFQSVYERDTRIKELQKQLKHVSDTMLIYRKQIEELTSEVTRIQEYPKKMDEKVKRLRDNSLQTIHQYIQKEQKAIADHRKTQVRADELSQAVEMLSHEVNQARTEVDELHAIKDTLRNDYISNLNAQKHSHEQENQRLAKQLDDRNQRVSALEARMESMLKQMIQHDSRM